MRRGLQRREERRQTDGRQIYSDFLNLRRGRRSKERTMHATYDRKKSQREQTMSVVKSLSRAELPGRLSGAPSHAHDLPLSVFFVVVVVSHQNPPFFCWYAAESAMAPIPSPRMDPQMRRTVPLLKGGLNVRCEWPCTPRHSGDATSTHTADTGGDASDTRQAQLCESMCEDSHDDTRRRGNKGHRNDADAARPTALSAPGPLPSSSARTSATAIARPSHAPSRMCTREARVECMDA